VKILLITSSIIPIAKDVKLLDTNARLHQTLSAIDKIKELNFFDEIYLCDGSDYKMRNCHGVNYMCFKQSTDIVSKYGKSYGELLIYEHFFSQTSIEDHASVYKISARWIVDNLDEILKKTQYFNNLFYTFYPYGFFRDYIHTSFFLSEIGRLKEMVEESKNMISQNPTIVLEKAFFRSLAKYKKTWVRLNYPKYNGIGGTENKSVKESFINFNTKNIISNCGMYAFTVDGK
jgi:hypothetical protein